VRCTCRSCGRTYVVAQELSGLAFRMKCKTCGQPIAVHPAAQAPILLSAILALLVAVYLFPNRDPSAPPARSPATAGARLPER